jgi:hypothetical protein
VNETKRVLLAFGAVVLGKLYLIVMTIFGSGSELAWRLDAQWRKHAAMGLCALMGSWVFAMMVRETDMGANPLWMRPFFLAVSLVLLAAGVGLFVVAYLRLSGMVQHLRLRRSARKR